MANPLNSRELLVRLLLADDAQARFASLEFSRLDKWPEAVRLASLWKVLPTLNRRVAALGADVGGSAQSTLHRMTAAGFVRSARSARKGVNALVELRQKGIPAAAFKGLAAIAGLYRTPRDRFIGDVDILIRQKDLNAALACLETLGFKPDLPGEFPDYVSFMRHSPAFAGNFSVALRDADQSEIDVHWRLGISGQASGTEQLIQRAREAELFGSAIPIVAPADNLILTSHHAVRENLTPDTTLRDVLDIEAWCLQLAAGGELQTALEYVASIGLTSSLLAIINIPPVFHSDSAVEPVAELLQRLARKTEVRTASQLTNLFVFQVHQGPLNRDLSYLFHPRSLRQIAGSFLKGWSKHRRFMQDMEIKNSGRPLPISDRIRFLVRAFAGLMPAQLRMIRALAKVRGTYQNGS